MNRLSELLGILGGDSSRFVKFGKYLKTPQQRYIFLLAVCPEIGIIRHADEAISFGCQEAQAILEGYWTTSASGSVCISIFGFDDDRPNSIKSSSFSI